MCVNCIRSQVDITEGIQKQVRHVAARLQCRLLGSCSGVGAGDWGWAIPQYTILNTREGGAVPSSWQGGVLRASGSCSGLAGGGVCWLLCRERFLLGESGSGLPSFKEEEGMAHSPVRRLWALCRAVSRTAEKWMELAIGWPVARGQGYKRRAVWQGKGWLNWERGRT